MRKQKTGKGKKEASPLRTKEEMKKPAAKNQRTKLVGSFGRN